MKFKQDLGERDIFISWIFFFFKMLVRKNPGSRGKTNPLQYRLSSSLPVLLVDSDFQAGNLPFLQMAFGHPQQLGSLKAPVAIPQSWML